MNGNNKKNTERNTSAMSPNERRRLEYLRQKRKREKKVRKIKIALACLTFALIVGGIVWSTLYALNSHEEDSEEAFEVIEISTEERTTEITTEEFVFEVKEATFVAVGDNLVHAGVFKAGLQSDGTHDYSCLYENVAKYFDDADIKAINQETIFGGDDKGFSGYPLFNSPTGIGDAVVDAGFNVVTHATNHVLDMGIDGLLYSVSFWKTNHPDVLVLGIYENEEEQSEITVMEVNGIKIAMLNYTYSHNWSTLSSSAKGHLNILCDYDESTGAIDFDTINPQVISDIEKAEELADFTIVFPHWGTEYVTGTTKQQTTFAKLMTEAGADLIVGTHPHVIEPVEWVYGDNGNKALCYYSLGNFTSTQDSIEGILGGMAKLTIIQDETGTYIDEESIKAIPLVTQYLYPGPNGYMETESTYLLADYTDELAAAHGLYKRKGISVTVEKLTTLAEDIFGEYYSLEY